VYYGSRELRTTNWRLPCTSCPDYLWEDDTCFWVAIVMYAVVVRNLSFFSSLTNNRRWCYEQ